MNKTDNLFEWAQRQQHYPNVPGYTKGSATSEAAATFMIPFAGTLRRRILDYIIVMGSATYDECVRDLGIKPQTASPRITELRLHGWIIDSGQVRKTRAGVEAVVYVLNPKAPVVLLGPKTP